MGCYFDARRQKAGHLKGCSVFMRAAASAAFDELYPSGEHGLTSISDRVVIDELT